MDFPVNIFAKKNYFVFTDVVNDVKDSRKVC